MGFGQVRLWCLLTVVGCVSSDAGLRLAFGFLVGLQRGWRGGGFGGGLGWCCACLGVRFCFAGLSASAASWWRSGVMVVEALVQWRFF